MIDITYDDLQQQTATNRLLCRQMLDKGWRVRVPKLPSPHLFIDRGDGQEIHSFSVTPPTVSFAAAHLANDKFATYVVLADNAILQLDTMFFVPGDDLSEALSFMNTHGSIVCKPIDGGHGNGITVNLRDEASLRDAIVFASQNNRSQKAILLQEQFIAEDIIDIRIAIVDGKAIAAIERVPAYVTGDGTHTVEQLIATENLSPDRGRPYHAKFASIDIDRAGAYLGKKLQDVPVAGSRYTVMGVANYGAGGELVDVTDDIPHWMLREAEEAASLLRLDIAGVDYMLDRRIDASMARDQVQAVITEVNKCPALAIHDEPTVGVNRQTIKAYIEYLEAL